MKKIIKPALEDREHSVDLFDGERLNSWGEMYCVAPAIPPGEVDFCWMRYKKSHENYFNGEKPFGSPGSGRDFG